MRIEDHERTLRKLLWLFIPIVASIAWFVSNFQPKETPAPVPTAGKEIVFYDWAEDIPQEVIDQFTAETGVKVKYETYESSEEAVEKIRAGNSYDVMVMENEFIPTLVSENLLQPLKAKRIPNIKNIHPAFLGLVHDPKNRYSIPYTWGTTGVVVRTDLISTPLTRWSDLWIQEFKGRIGFRSLPRETLGVIQMSLGKSINTENPAEIEQAMVNLLARKENIVLVDDDTSAAATLLEEGKIAALIGWSGDVREARDRGLAVDYILPEEGIVFWGDSYTIPARSTKEVLASQFINFLLQPEISAKITNQVGYASANQAAQPWIDPSILADPAVYPLGGDVVKLMQKAQIILPVSKAAENSYLETWARFLSVIDD